MKTWRVESAGESWTVDAPDDVSEAEVNEFAAANYASWVNGGRYRMDPIGAPATPATPAPEKPDAPGKEDYDRAVALLDQQIATLNKSRKTPGPGETMQGRSLIQEPEIDAEVAKLQALRDKFAIGSTGSTVGGIGGALAGGAAGAVALSPLGVPGMAIGGVIGSILGGAGGVAAGTHLWDIPAARETREVTDQEAVDLIKARALEAVIWDGAFVLILGPGGRVIGKMTKGARFLPALKAAAKESMSWDKLPKVKSDQLAKVVAERAEKVPAGMATQVSRALDVPTSRTTVEAAEDLVTDIAARSGGRVPTTGEMSGIVEGAEGFARRQSPMPFFQNDVILARTAEEIRSTALRDLDAAGALTGPELGTAISRVADSAEATVKRVTKPVFERAAGAGVNVDMTPTVRYIESVLAKDAAAAGLPLKGERAGLEAMLAKLQEPNVFSPRRTPVMTAEGAQDFISALKAEGRGVRSDGTKPNEYMSKVLRDMKKLASNSFTAALDSVDPLLRRDLDGVRKLYRESLTDLYADGMAMAAIKTPEDVGKALVSKGSVTEIQELRKALDRAAKQAPGKSRYQGGVKPENLKELGKAEIEAQRRQIDAGLIKGYIEQHTVSLDNLPTKLRDPEFRRTLKELLTGRGVADPALGQKVLDELDRTAGVLKLVNPQYAPQPGRALGAPGVGNISPVTIIGGATGQPISTSAPAALTALLGFRQIGKVMATAMTSGNTGSFRALQRAITLSRLAGTNAAAAEAARAAWAELETQ